MPKTPPITTSSPAKKKERTFEAIRDLLIYESQKHPLIMVVDDLHWIDKTSEEFLDYLIGWLTGARILLLLLYRPEYTHPWGSKSYYNRVGLSQLTPKSSAELIRSILQVGDAVPELEEFILERTTGNPLYSRSDNFEKAYQFMNLSGGKTLRNHSASEGIKDPLPETIGWAFASRSV